MSGRPVSPGRFIVHTDVKSVFGDLHFLKQPGEVEYRAQYVMSGAAAEGTTVEQQPDTSSFDTGAGRLKVKVVYMPVSYTHLTLPTIPLV